SLTCAGSQPYQRNYFPYERLLRRSARPDVTDGGNSLARTFQCPDLTGCAGICYFAPRYRRSPSHEADERKKDLPICSYRPSRPVIECRSSSDRPARDLLTVYGCETLETRPHRAVELFAARFTITIGLGRNTPLPHIRHCDPSSNSPRAASCWRIPKIE